MWLIKCSQMWNPHVSVELSYICPDVTLCMTSDLFNGFISYRIEGIQPETEIPFYFQHIKGLSRLITGSSHSHTALGPQQRRHLIYSHDCHLVPALSIRCSISPLVSHGRHNNTIQDWNPLIVTPLLIHTAGPASCLHSILAIQLDRRACDRTMGPARC